MPRLLILSVTKWADPEAHDSESSRQDPLKSGISRNFNAPIDVVIDRYLRRSGFLMADDFWAPGGWATTRREMKRVFPDREPNELSAAPRVWTPVRPCQAA